MLKWKIVQFLCLFIEQEIKKRIKAILNYITKKVIIIYILINVVFSM